MLQSRDLLLVIYNIKYISYLHIAVRVLESRDLFTVIYISKYISYLHNS